MKDADQYHKWVEWGDEDQVYIGKCPDLITGIHGDDPVKLQRFQHQIVTINILCYCKIFLKSETCLNFSHYF